MNNELQVIVPWAPFCLSPDLRSGMESQLLFGERFTVRSVRSGWCEGVAELDGSEGFVPRAALGPSLGTPTHQVHTLRTPVYSAPDHRSPSDKMVSFLTPVVIQDEKDDFAKVAGLGWLAKSHLEPVGNCATEMAAVAERFVGTPYLWGGRTSLGLDDYGLLQLCLQAVGQPTPDENGLAGKALPGGLHAEAKRGDLLFLPEQSGIFIDSDQVVHAHNGKGRHLTTFVQPLHELLTSLGETDREGGAIHRLD